MTSKRYDYVDVMKFIGIICIYIGHFATNAFRLYPFVFIFHVHLFFFISGFFAKDNIKFIKNYYEEFLGKKHLNKKKE